MSFSWQFIDLFIYLFFAPEYTLIIEETKAGLCVQIRAARVLYRGSSGTDRLRLNYNPLVQNFRMKS